MVVYEKIYFEAYINNQYIWHKNNVAQLYFILGRAEQYRNFFSIPMDGSDIDRFFQQEVDLNHVHNSNLLNFLQGVMVF